MKSKSNIKESERYQMDTDPDGEPILPKGKSTKENPVKLNLSDSTNKDFIRGVTPDMDPTLLKIQIESNILNHFNFGTKGTINNFNPRVTTLL